MMRYMLFAATNMAVLLVITVIFQLFGLEDVLRNSGGGMNLTGLLVMSAVFGFVGSFISLAMSKRSAKRQTGAHVIEQPRNEQETWLLKTVQRQAEQAGIGQPEVAIYDSNDVNAFATGMRRNNALVAVSTGLLNSMTKAEAEAVLAHEVSHVANGDMVTMTLLQGVMNTFVIFFSRIFAQIAASAMKNRGMERMVYFAVSMAMQVLFGFLASIITSWFSRRREFRADAGGAELAGRQNMIDALKRLQQGQPQALPEQLSAFGIGGGNSKFGALFRTHPPLEQRIQTLEQQTPQFR